MLTLMNAESQARLYSREQTGPKLDSLGPQVERAEEVLTPLARQLLASLHRRFNARRLELLNARAQRQALLDDGALPEFLADTAAVRAADWRISPVPADLADRRVEITGPVDRKMVINALNAPVRAFMADFEDSCSPTWDNVIRGQVNLNDAVRGTISHEDRATGKVYRLAEHTATLIKKFRNRRDFLLPDRATVTMDRHFLKSYVDLLIKTCHRRGAHAMGGMAAQIPIRDDPQANEAAMARVRADKLREAHAGHDGTWIAHPGLAQIAREAFDALMPGPNQLGVLRAEVDVTPRDLLTVPEGEITEGGLRGCIRVGVQYLEAWLRGNGCVPLYHLMEDAATAEICRAQLWQWLRHGARTSDGQLVTVERFDRLLSAELDRIHDEVGAARLTHGVFPTAARLFEQMTKSETFDEFLTLPAYELLS